jgi:hypothetical protein
MFAWHVEVVRPIGIAGVARLDVQPAVGTRTICRSSVISETIAMGTSKISAARREPLRRSAAPDRPARRLREAPLVAAGRYPGYSPSGTPLQINAHQVRDSHDRLAERGHDCIGAETPHGVLGEKLAGAFQRASTIRTSGQRRRNRLQK